MNDHPVVLGNTVSAPTATSVPPGGYQHPTGVWVQATTDAGVSGLAYVPLGSADTERVAEAVTQHLLQVQQWAARHICEPLPPMTETQHEIA